MSDELRSCNNCYYEEVTIQRCKDCKRELTFEQWRPKSKLEYNKHTIKAYFSIGIKPRSKGEEKCHGCMYYFEECSAYRKHMVKKGFKDCRDGIEYIYHIKKLNKRKPKEFKG